MFVFHKSLCLDVIYIPVLPYKKMLTVMFTHRHHSDIAYPIAWCFCHTSPITFPAQSPSSFPFSLSPPLITIIVVNGNSSVDDEDDDNDDDEI